MPRIFHQAFSKRDSRIKDSGPERPQRRPPRQPSKDRQNLKTLYTTLIFLFLILGLVMISSSHSIDKKVYEIAGLNDEIKSLRSEFVDVRSSLMKLRMESSINERLSKKGIISSKTPPVKIVIDVTN